MKKKRRKRLLLFKNIYKTIELYWKIDKVSFCVFFISVLCLAIIPFITSYLFGRLINSVTSYLGGGDISRSSIFKLFIIAGLLGLVENLIWEISTFARRFAKYNWQEAMVYQVSAKLSGLDYSKYEDSKFNNFINKVKDGYIWKPEIFANTLPWLVYNSIKIISSIAILFTLSPIILIVIGVSIIPTILVERKASRYVYGIWDTKGDEKKLFGATSGYLSDPKRIGEIRIFGVRSFLLTRARELYQNFQNEQKRIVKSAQIKRMFAGLLEFSLLLSIEIWLLTKVLARGAFGIGNFTFYRSTIYSFLGALRDFTQNITDLYDNNLYMTDLFKLFDIKNKIVSKPEAQKVPLDKVPLIEFKQVSFKYPNSDKYIYKDFSLKIEPGEDIALVGENGAGKTTFVKLLMRFFDVDEGEILINGQNIKDIDLETWYKNIGVLFQEFNQYIYSAEENIWFGNITKSISGSEVIEAAKNAGAHNFILEYKHKYKQMLGKQFKDGIEPSGGQWQRIALARAFFRNANILILDEPTSAIDAKAEYEIFKRIAKVQEEKTTIIISHRFSTVRNAHKIYVIDHGQIIEEGSHSELMKIESGKYKEMFELQAEGYR